MRILAFSDLHRDRDAARAIADASQGADVVVGAGDFATRGVGLPDTIALLRDITKPTVLVAGNHDDVAELRIACRDWESVHVLHGDCVVIGELSFFGLGYEISSGKKEAWSQALEETAAVELLEACPKGAILVTHSPPLGIADVQLNGSHGGSRSIREAIISSPPKLHLCGHIHHAWGTSGSIGDCRVHNLGPTVNWLAV